MGSSNPHMKLIHVSHLSKLHYRKGSFFHQWSRVYWNLLLDKALATWRLVCIYATVFMRDKYHITLYAVKNQIHAYRIHWNWRQHSQKWIFEEGMQRIWFNTAAYLRWKMPLHTPSPVTTQAALKIGTSGIAKTPPKHSSPPPQLSAPPCTAGFNEC